MTNKKRIKLNRILLYLFIVTILVLAGIIYVCPMVSGALARTSIVEYGNLRVASHATCYFIRSENVVKATNSGTVQYYFEEGELVRKGTKVADMISSGAGYSTEKNSLISYYIDGLEEVFTPEKMTSLKRDKIESLEIQVNDVRRESAITGEPLYKVVDSSPWYVALWAEAKDVIKYEKNKKVSLNLPLGQVKGTVYDIIDSQGAWLILIRFTGYYEDLPKLRRIDAEIITSDYEGLIIPNRSITAADGKPGVYVKDISGEFVFKPVSVITSNGEFSLVEGSFFYNKDGDKEVKIKTVEAYDEILNNPEKR